MPRVHSEYGSASGMVSSVSMVSNKSKREDDKMSVSNVRRSSDAKKESEQAMSGVDEKVGVSHNVNEVETVYNEHTMSEVCEKFDSGASHNMSGNIKRIRGELQTDCMSQGIRGFDGTIRRIDGIGVNDDGKNEYFVSAMPDTLALLCAHDYASEGAAILFKDDGVVLRMTSEEQAKLKLFLQQFKTSLVLKVNNRTYEVDRGLHECGYSSTSTRFFNTKVNISNGTERVLTMLMTGLSFRDLYLLVKHNSLSGMPVDLTCSMLNKFENKYGRNPDIVKLALPLNNKNIKGLMAEARVLSRCGDLVEIDVFESDYIDNTNGKTKKLPTHGGAIAAVLCVDVFSGYVISKLLKSMAHSIEYVKELVERVELEKIQINELASDSGVTSQAMFNTWTPEVEAYLLSKGIRSKRAEPYNHSIGTACVERMIRSVKDLIRQAVVYILRNPNFGALGYDVKDIVKLWGELANWSTAVINCKPCPRDQSMTRYEKFKGVKPNMQNIRLLPIFSVVLVLRHESIVPYSNQQQYQVALYVGPSMTTPGAIRAVVKTNGLIRIIVTSKYTSASDGGGLTVYPHIERGVSKLIEEEEVKEVQMHQVVEAESDAPVSVNEVIDENEAVRRVEESKKHSISTTSNSNQVNESVYKKYYPRRSPRLNDNVMEGHSVDVLDWMNSNRENIGLTTVSELERACYADWSTYSDEQTYFSWSEGCFYELIDEKRSSSECNNECVCEEGFKAVNDNVPRTFEEALKSPVWGEAARKEWQTLIDTKAIVEVDTGIARDAIKNQQADLVLLFPVYEQKVKEGKVVFKVRLVGDGRSQYHAGETYASTPSREELLILLHVIAAKGWTYAHVDEIRAFLSTTYNGEKRVFTKHRHNKDYYEVIGALYGLRTSPRDYQRAVVERLSSIGFKRLTTCPCMYLYREGDEVVIIYDFVDDFIFTGSNKQLIERKIDELRGIVTTTEPVWEADNVLGIQIKRIKEKKIVCITMESKILELSKKCDVGQHTRKSLVPMPVGGYIVKPDDLDCLGDDSILLSEDDKKKYMMIVGSLVWISGIRLDIVFAVMYLTWSTRCPRVHHMKMAMRCVSYLYYSSDMPLVLGGNENMNIRGYTDASLGTAPKGRSVTGQVIKLNEGSGAVIAKSRTTTAVVTSSFEAELDGAVNLVKLTSRVRNILDELCVVYERVAELKSDNEAMINFVKGNNVAKGVRHMELRMWKLRDTYDRGLDNLGYSKGKGLLPDKLTKLGDVQGHCEYANEIMGLGLLEQSTMSNDLEVSKSISSAYAVNVRDDTATLKGCVGSNRFSVLNANE